MGVMTRALVLAGQTSAQDPQPTHGVPFFGFEGAIHAAVFRSIDALFQSMGDAVDRLELSGKIAPASQAPGRHAAEPQLV